MAAIFLDTSAIVRRYDPTEPGAALVRALCSRAAGHTLWLASLTSVEVASALNRKVRDGSLSVYERNGKWRLFRFHWRHQYTIHDLDAGTYRSAERLLFQYPLRAFDAVHVAAALVVRRRFGSRAVDFCFCTADERQRRAAEAEGLTVEFIT